MMDVQFTKNGTQRKTRNSIFEVAVKDDEQKAGNFYTESENKDRLFKIYKSK